MESRISNLKTDFNTITLVRSKIINIFELLKNKSDKLKTLYSEFIRNNNSSQSFIFGLDSFHFQNKLIDLENDDMKRMFLIINNRMYCEYFKLYKIMVSYINDNIQDKKIIEIIKGSNFPVYKDLEPFKDYKFETISDIHENILILLNSIVSIINNKENELSLHQSKRTSGLNIDNFVNSFNFEITIMREKINLFLLYMEFFHKLHNKYLRRFNNKIQILLNNINSDINFDDDTEENNKEIEYINDKNVKTDNNISITTSDKNLNLNIDVIGLNENANIGLINFESGTNTPSNSSFASTENSSSQKKKFKVPSIIKNGFRKVNNIINGCNNKNVDDVLDNRNLQLEELVIPDKSNLTISLNDFNDNTETETNDINDINENAKEITQEIEDIISAVFYNEKEIQTDTVVVSNVVDEIFSFEEHNVVIVEEHDVTVEEPIVIVEEPDVTVEEPIVIVEEPEVTVEEPNVTVDEPEAVVEEPEVTVEEPEAVVEEPNVTVEEPEAVVEEPIVTVEEPIVIVEEPEALVEEPNVTVEEPEAVVEEPIVTVEEPIVIVEEPEALVEEPNVTVDEPEVTVEEPIVTVEEPEVTVEEPEAVVEEPNVTVEEPEAVGEEPIVTVEESIVIVEEPIVIVEEPEVVVEEQEIILSEE